MARFAVTGHLVTGSSVLVRLASWRVAAALVLLVLAPGLLAGADLRTLVAEYSSAKSSLNKIPRNERERHVKDHVLPAARAIAKLGDEKALKFLESEYLGDAGEVGAACAKALLESSDDRALEMVLSGLPRKSPELKIDILGALAEAKRSLAPGEARLLELLRAEKHAGVSKAIVPVLAKIDTLEVAKTLVAAVKPLAPNARGKPAEEAEAFNDAVVAALRSTKSDAVKSYLAEEAFRRAPATRLAVLTRVAGSLKLTAAREEIVKNIGHADEDVALASVEAIEKIGVGDAVGTLAEFVRSGGKKLSLGLLIQLLDALAASGSDEALAVVLEAASAPELETRAIAMGSLSRQPESVKAFEGLLKGLGDPAYEVRNAAIRSLGRVRSKAMIAPLIALMGREKEEKLKIDALQLLIRLTGQNMGLETEDWNKWWEVAEAKFEFPKEGDKGFTGVKTYDLEYFGLEVNSKRLAFLVDASSSMLQTVDVKRRQDDKKGEGGEGSGRTRPVPRPGEGDAGGAGGLKPGKARKIDVLKAELERVIRELSVDTSINIVYFHAKYDSWKKELQPLAGRGRAQAIGFVRDLNNGSGTNVYDTLEFALRDKRVDTIFLLTDGLPSRGRFTEPAAILREIGKLNRVRGATIHCIAFGEESDLLKNLAKQNGGEYRFVNEY